MSITLSRRYQSQTNCTNFIQECFWDSFEEKLNNIKLNFMGFITCMILLPDKTFLNLDYYLRKSTILILIFRIYLLGSNRDQVSKQIFNGTISLKHAIPFDPNIYIVIGKLLLLTLNFLIASTYLLRIYIIRIWLLIHTIFHLNISFSVEINCEVVLLFWYESFNFWRCSSFHLSGFHLALCAW